VGIINTQCNCGVKVTVRTGDDAKTVGRKDGKQVVYTNDERRYGTREYDIFRCEKCHEPIHETCAEAAFET
jgi:hypothetical protein